MPEATFSTVPSPVHRSVDPNAIDLSKFRGAVERCPQCFVPKQVVREGKKVTIVMADELRLSGTTCRLCMDQRFVAKCTNCDGTGKYNGKTVWDGGQNDHVTTCNPCGGAGFFPTKKPKDWQDGEAGR